MTYSPWTALSALDDVIVGYVPLPSGHSWWEPDERVILIDPALDRITRRCALAHELEHIHAGDAACNYTGDDEWFDTRMERRAWSRAARKLVAIEDLARALAIHEGDDPAVCELLEVTQLVLDVRREYLGSDERHYLKRRLERIEESA